MFTNLNKDSFDIGLNKNIFLIAEIGINHNGDMRIVKKLVDAANACNWHCVKFQKRTPEICVPEHQKQLLKQTPWGEMTYLDYKFKIEFEKDEYSIIDSYCKEKSILWTASVWDIPSLKFILEFDVPFIKIPSAKLTDNELIVEAAKSGKPIILSTGMSSVEEIDFAYELLNKNAKTDFALMHTNSTYPTPNDELNLRVITFLKDRYDCIIGYSGHEYDLEPSVIAVVLGAQIIERHITLDHNMWGSDQHASLEVHAMSILEKRIKDIVQALGNGIKTVSKNEKEIRKKLRG
ncbi:N-acetylneuraminate synthase [Candidatus Magnetomorum sp. HK-1]|nr:N-acetylneuraminate synthase [Candidatus Magnetomorum sp. HK-1]